MSNGNPSHCVAIIGGAVAGAETAGLLADRGVEVVVLEQNPRPYGKIEDGLPRWHVALRKKEYQRIGEHLSRPEVHYVPLTTIGKDVDFKELIDSWGFTGVVLANGAWRDRPLPVDGADEYIDKGLIYQNPFIIWYNHANEKDYKGARFEVKDDALVVGGGLASIDVVKALMLETTLAKLRERGIEEDMVEMEVKGIPRILAKHDLKFEDLGIKGCKLFYRRRAMDMPMMDMPKDATPEREKKVQAGRERMLKKAMEKYLFQFVPLCMPDELTVENGQLVGLRFRRTTMESGRPQPTDETFEERGSYIISSIGSIPLAIEGIPTRGELFNFSDWDLGRIEGFPTLFSVGNIVTGQGNIVASRKHAREVTATIAEAFLGLSDHAGEEAISDGAHAAAREQAEKVADAITKQPPVDAGTLEKLRTRVRERQQAVGYEGDYKAWIERVTPPDLE